MLMNEPLFLPFRLVGGTNISLIYGHRQSDDIDLFTDAVYGSIDFNKLENWLRSNFPYFDTSDITSIVGNGRSYYIGENDDECVKLDLIYTDDPFIKPVNNIGIYRFADIKDIIAMKLLVIQNGGRKKDFWDLHLLNQFFEFEEMLGYYQNRSPYIYDRKTIISQLKNFQVADNDPDPRCLFSKNWDEIKLDFIEITDSLL